MEPKVAQIQTPKPWNQVTPLSKYLAMTLFISMPFIGGWVGYKYAPKKIVEVERPVSVYIDRIIDEKKNDNATIWEKAVETADITTPVSLQSSSSTSTLVATCEDGFSSHQIDTENWVSVSPGGLFFKTIAPTTVTINRIAGQEWPANYTLIDSKTGLEAGIFVTLLEDEIFTFGSKYGSTYTYELNSNTVWRSPGYGEIFKQCIPQSDNFTKNNAIVFKFSDGDAGAFVVRYAIIMKPTEAGYKLYDGNRAVGIGIRYEGDGNDPTYSDEKYGEFESIIEGMIQNMTLMPTSKG